MRLNSMPPPDRQVTKPIVLRHRVRARFWMPLLVVLGCVAETPEPGGISTWTIGSEPVVTIGSIDGEAPYLLSGIQAVELLPDDRIAVIDGSSQTIRIYDASGLFERQLGGKGQGPGEFTDVYYLTSVHADTIVAYDVEALRFSVFLTSGELVSTCPVQVEDGQPSLYFGTYSNGDRGLGWIRSVERDQSVITADIMDLTGFGADGRAVTPLASLHAAFRPPGLVGACSSGRCALAAPGRPRRAGLPMARDGQRRGRDRPGRSSTHAHRLVEQRRRALGIADGRPGGALVGAVPGEATAVRNGRRTLLDHPAVDAGRSPLRNRSTGTQRTPSISNCSSPLYSNIASHSG
jgi:hypothetical protein